MSLEYILNEDSKNRALSYIVWNIFKDLDLYEKLDSTTKTGKLFKKEIEKDALLPNADALTKSYDLENATKYSKSVLGLKQNEDIVKEYHRTATKNKNFQWYSMFDGPKNIEQLSKILSKHASYEVFYRQLSKDVHATNVHVRKLSSESKGDVSVIQLRTPQDTGTVIQLVDNFILMSFMKYINVRLPERKDEFKNWYMTFRKV
ncbi:hypothetical protein J4E06_07090 [Muricauda sp. NFXS6]